MESDMDGVFIFDLLIVVVRDTLIVIITWELC